MNNVIEDLWIPVKFKPITPEERAKPAYAYGIDESEVDDTEMLDCPLPEDGQAVLLSLENEVFDDICKWDQFGCGLKYYLSWTGVTAWMPFPKPYRG